MSMIHVYYDGACGLCRREIEHYQRLVPLSGAQIRWVDVMAGPDVLMLEHLEGPLAATPLTLLEALMALHVVDAEGRLHRGVAAFAVVWRCFPRWHWLAMLVSLPLVRHLADVVYALFARWRFQRLGYACSTASGVT